jgi:hypothetical protein
MKVNERAWQAWPVLTLAARNRQTLTYELLGRLTNMHAAGLGQVLEHVQSYCLLHKLPPLSAIVVSKDTGLPSPGFVATSDVPRAFNKVFEHDWLITACPTPDELTQATKQLPSNGKPAAALK